MLELKKFIVIILYLSLVITEMPCLASDIDLTEINKTNLGSLKAPPTALTQQASEKLHFQDLKNDNVDLMLPYIKYVERKIKMNWDPPKWDESRRIVVRFKIAKDGRLLYTQILKSSGNADADRAALKAIQASAPFKAFPYNYKKNSIDIEFYFQYQLKNKN